MPCENYREALTEAAAGNTHELSMGLQAHLDACSVCRAFFAEERRLFAAIDSGTRATANGQVPPSLLPRVRGRLDQRTELSWIKAGALVAAAVILVATTVSIRGRIWKSHGQEANAVVAARHNSGTVEPPVKPPVAPSQTDRAQSRARARKEGAVRDSQPSVIPVLVPAGEKAAIDALLVAMRSQAAKPRVLLEAKNGPSGQSREIAPLGIPAIEIEPLAAVSPEETPPDEPTRF